MTRNEKLKLETEVEGAKSGIFSRTAVLGGVRGGVRPMTWADGERWAASVERDPHLHCEAVRLAVARQRRDLRDPPSGCVFDDSLAHKVITFIELLPLVKGRHTQFGLAPWQAWWVGVLFGWRSQKVRRFTEAHLWVPKKNGKSSLAAAVALWMLCMDGEAAPEIYVAATKMDQARIVAEIAHAMVRQSKALRSSFQLELTGNSSARPPHIKCGFNGGLLRPLARDQSGTQDGLDVSCAVIDEIHAHTTREIYDLMAQGTASRAQPLVLITSTAGFNSAGIGRQRQDALLRVLRGEQSAEHMFGVIWTIDDADDAEDGWRRPTTWAKANPNLGVAVCLDPRTSGPMGAAWERAGLRVVDVPSTPATMSYPLRRWQAMLIAEEFSHDGNPAVAWMVGNVQEVVRGDGTLSALTQPDRAARVDAARALLLAAAVALGWRDEPDDQPGRFIAI